MKTELHTLEGWMDRWSNDIRGLTDKEQRSYFHTIRRKREKDGRERDIRVIQPQLARFALKERLNRQRRNRFTQVKGSLAHQARVSSGDIPDSLVFTKVMQLKLRRELLKRRTQ